MDKGKQNLIDNLNNEELRRVYLVRYICQNSKNLDKILQSLMQDEVISQSEFDMVVNCPNCEDENRGKDYIRFFHFFNILAGKIPNDESHYFSFKNAMKNSGNKDIVTLLETLTEDYRCAICYDPFCLNHGNDKLSKKKKQKRKFKLSSWVTV